MNYATILILKIVLLVIYSFLNWNIFLLYKKRNLKKDNSKIIENNRKSDTIEETNANKNILLFGIFGLVVCIFILIPFGTNDIYFYDSPYSLLIIYALYLTIPLLFALIQNQRAKEYSTNLIRFISSKYLIYVLPLIFSIISIFITINNIESIQFEEGTFTFKTLIEFQKNYEISILNQKIPANLIIINPISFFAYLLSIIGFYRESNLDENNILNFSDPKYIVIKEKKMFNLINASLFFTMVILIVPLFLGRLYYFENDILNLGVTIIITTLLIILIVSILRSKLDMFLKIFYQKYNKIPLLLSIIAIIYAYIVPYYTIA